MTTLADHRCDVAVIGGGVVGLCTARLLADHGATVQVLEAAQVGDGASGQGHGQVLMGLIEHPYRVVDALGTTDASALYATCEASAALLKGWGLLVHEGGWWVSLDDREPDQIRRSAEALEHVGIASDVATPSEVAMQLHLGDAGPALRVPSEGIVHPLRALEALQVMATEAGVIVRPDWPISRVQGDPRSMLVRGSRGSVRCEMVVYAAGAGVLDLEPFFHEKVVPVREQSLRSEGTSPLPPQASMRAGYGYTWWRRDPTHRGTVVGGCRWATPHLEVGETRAVVGAAVQQRLEAFLHRLHPDARVTDRRAWIEAHTCDGLPVVGPLPGSPREVACVGMCGNDWGLGPALAQSVADGLMADGPSRAEPRFAASRFL